MGIYDRHIATVKRLIAKYGQDVIFRSTNQAIADSTKPWENTETTPNETTVKMVFIDPSTTGTSLIGKEILQYLKGTSIPSGVVRGLCAPFAYVPKLNDVFIRDGNQLTVSGIDTLAPGGISIMHTLEFDV